MARICRSRVFMTNKLTDKSDVYSFGVLLLELLMACLSIAHGKNIVREVTFLILRFLHTQVLLHWNVEMLLATSICVLLSGLLWIFERYLPHLQKNGDVLNSLEKHQPSRSAVDDKCRCKMRLKRERSRRECFCMGPYPQKASNHSWGSHWHVYTPTKIWGLKWYWK